MDYVTWVDGFIAHHEVQAYPGTAEMGKKAGFHLVHLLAGSGEKTLTHVPKKAGWRLNDLPRRT